MGKRMGLCIVGIALASLAVASSPRPEIELPTNRGDLAAARVQVARRALERIELRRAASPVFWAEPGPGMKGIVAWSRRLMEAETNVSTTKAGRLEAIRGHIGRLEEWLTILKAQRDTIRGSGDDLDLVEYYRLESEELLLAVQAERE